MCFVVFNMAKVILARKCCKIRKDPHKGGSPEEPETPGRGGGGSLDRLMKILEVQILNYWRVYFLLKGSVGTWNLIKTHFKIISF
jgi:hypothetical protein